MTVMSLRVWGGQCGAQSCDKADLKAGICFGGFRSKKDCLVLHMRGQVQFH